MPATRERADPVPRVLTDGLGFEAETISAGELERAVVAALLAARGRGVTVSDLLANLWPGVVAVLAAARLKNVMQRVNAKLDAIGCPVRVGSDRGTLRLV